MNKMRQYTSPTSIISSDQMIYDLLNEDDVLIEMNKIIAETNEILGLPSTSIVRLLLNYFHWDKDILTDRYWEDSDKLFRLCKVANPTSSTSIDYNPLSPTPAAEEDSFVKSKKRRSATCRTCYSEKDLNEFYSLPCGHQHCLTCWLSYLSVSINQNNTGLHIYCPSRCNQIVDDEHIFRLLNDDQRLKQRYRQIIVNTFVESNRLTNWCPGKSCTTIVKLKSSLTDYAHSICCDVCNTTFCFRCSNQWHEPIQCSLLQKWEKKNRDESMTSQWLVVNTKDCPKCQTSIEKNGGCNHMTCKRPGCIHEFCWICLTPWRDHASRQCNVYRGDDTTKNQAKARESLDRYIHYFNRYRTHQQSLDFEDKLSEDVAQRKYEMQAEFMSITEQKALDNAVNVLKQCRYALKYTYAFAYYLYPNNQAVVFERNQADLERATEDLSGFLEREIDPKQSIALQLMDKIAYCRHRRQALLDHCKEGYTQHYWAGLDTY